MNKKDWTVEYCEEDENHDAGWFFFVHDKYGPYSTEEGAWEGLDSFEDSYYRMED